MNRKRKGPHPMKVTVVGEWTVKHMEAYQDFVMQNEEILRRRWEEERRIRADNTHRKDADE